MEFLINGQVAALKKGTSFEFITENRYFTGSDSYTLSITFPLRGCAQNLAIFGNIHRTDVDKGKVLFDCEIRDRGFYKAGSVTIVELNEVEVKTQFLEGRSEQNFDESFDDVYINNLDLGKPYITQSSAITPDLAWQGSEAVALPWCNNASGNIQNDVEFVNGSYKWTAETRGLSWQPFLLVIAKRICDAVGYAYDFTEWEQSSYRYLLICNTLPYAWNMSDYAAALPHWTVAEFFEKLEYFMNCEFDINHKARSISFTFSKTAIENAAPVLLDNVLDEYSTTVSQDENSCEYRESQNLVFRKCDHQMWMYYDCRWFIEEFRNANYIKEYATMNELVADAGYYKVVRNYGRGTLVQQMLYARDVDTYFIFRAYKNVVVSVMKVGSHELKTYDYYLRLQPVNQFGGRIASEEEEASEIELDFVPAYIDLTEDTKGDCLFLSFSDYNEDTANVGDTDFRSEEWQSQLFQPLSVQRLQNGEGVERSQYFDRIYVGFWNGNIPKRGLYPFPITDRVVCFPDMTWKEYDFSLRINSRQKSSGFVTNDINPKQRYTFSFLADRIPNIRSVFHINGKRYLCERLTATFTESGRSQKIQAQFWKIEE